MIDTVIDGDFLVKGFTYIIGNRVVNCTKSGYYFENSRSLFGQVGSSLSETAVDAECEYELVQYYTFGDYIQNATERFISNTSYYDEATHRAFGKYLRVLRDVKHINLMNMYNCFSYQLISNINLHSNKIEQSSTEDKVFAIPIKFNREYTLLIDCLNIKIAPIFLYDKGACAQGSELYIANNLISPYFNVTCVNTPKYKFCFSLDSLKNKTIKEVTAEEYKSWTGSKYIETDSPVKYMIVEEHEQPLNDDARTLLYKNEKYLYLAIQIPKGNTSRIVCIENHHECNDYVYDVSTVDNVPQEILMNTLQSKNELCKSTLDKTTYAYSTQIIPYLLHHVVTNNEWISENIMHIQELLNHDDQYIFEDTVWSNKLQYLLYRAAMNAPELYDKHDCIGFLDKDLEHYLHSAYSKKEGV